MSCRNTNKEFYGFPTSNSPSSRISAILQAAFLPRISTFSRFPSRLAAALWFQQNLADSKRQATDGHLGKKKHPKHYQLNLGVQKRNVNIISQILRWIILVPICPNTKRKRWVYGSKSHLFWSKPWPHGLEILRSRVAVNSPLSETCLLQKLAFFLLIESINIHTIL